MKVNEQEINQQLEYTLKSTSLENLGEKLSGKVRDVYVKGDKIFFISTDRQSAFDRHIATIPFKGQVLTQISTYWFQKTKEIIKNHFIEEVDPNVLMCKKLEVFPIEFVVRGFLTGVTSTSVWTAYAKGERSFCGNELPENMKKNQPFEEPLVTPTTKSEVHDEKITPEEIIKKNFMKEEEWEYCRKKVLELFSFGQKLVAKKRINIS